MRGHGEVQHEVSVHSHPEAIERNDGGKVQREVPTLYIGNGEVQPQNPRRRARGCRAGKSVRRSTAPARRCPGLLSGVRLTPVAQVVAAVNAVGQAGAALGFNAAEVCCMVGGISCWLSSGRDGWWWGPPADTAAEQESGPPWAQSGSAACVRFEPGPSTVGPQVVRRDPAGREAAAVGPQGGGQDPVGLSAAGSSALRCAWRQESPGARRRATTGGLPGPDACYDRRLATNEGLTRPEACHDRRFDDSDGSDDGDADQVAEGMVGGNNGCTDVQADVCAWCCEPPFDGHGSAQCIQVPGQQRVKSPDKQGVAAPASVWLWEPPRDGRGFFLPRGSGQSPSGRKVPARFWWWRGAAGGAGHWAGGVSDCRGGASCPPLAHRFAFAGQGSQRLRRDAERSAYPLAVAGRGSEAVECRLPGCAAHRSSVLRCGSSAIGRRQSGHAAHRSCKRPAGMR
jgi:hypothetical protein